MEVPRCDGCGLWGHAYSHGPGQGEQRWCRSLNIHTAPNFGCIRWIDKAAIPIPVPAKHDRREADK